MPVTVKTNKLSAKGAPRNWIIFVCNVVVSLIKEMRKTILCCKWSILSSLSYLARDMTSVWMALLRLLLFTICHVFIFIYHHCPNYIIFHLNYSENVLADPLL